jgi:REP element-mobilizing transposase RayT
MIYNPDKHHRKSIRLKEYDYTQEGAYFITPCTRGKKLYFELYPELKHIVQTQWESLPKCFPNIALDAFVIMPNHVHAIIIVGATLAVAQSRAGASPAPTLGNVVGTFKSLCVNEWLRYIKQNNLNAVGAIWQRNYYEHIVRNELELNQVREYIVTNPLKWYFDRENPSHLIDPVYSMEWKWLEGET